MFKKKIEEKPVEPMPQPKTIQEGSAEKELQEAESNERYIADSIITQTAPVLIDTKTVIDGKPKAYSDILEILAEILNKQERLENLLLEALKD